MKHFEELNPEETKKLLKKYPFLSPYDYVTGELPDDYDYSYIFPLEIPAGWDALFLQFCEDAKKALIEANYLDNFRLSQVKEKYGQLRIYHEGAPREVEIIIDKYEKMAGFICVDCGQPAEYMTTGWILPVCKECSKKYTGKLTPIQKPDSSSNEWDRYIHTLKMES